MAGLTRFELATSGVTGQRSNQLNYNPGFFISYYDLGLNIAFSLGPKMFFIFCQKKEKSPITGL